MDKKDWQNRAIAALDRAGIYTDARGKCAQCGGSDFLVVDSPILPPVVDFNSEEGDEDNAPTIPCVGLICKRCGNLRLFSAGYLGMMEPKAAREPNLHPSRPALSLRMTGR